MLPNDGRGRPADRAASVGEALEISLQRDLDALAHAALKNGRARGHVAGLGELLATVDVLPADVVRRRATGRLELITSTGRTVSFIRIGGGR